MDERGGNLSDTSPIIRIKAATKKLIEELQQMEVRPAGSCLVSALFCSPLCEYVGTGGGLLQRAFCSRWRWGIAL